MYPARLRGRVVGLLGTGPGRRGRPRRVRRRRPGRPARRPDGGRRSRAPSASSAPSATPGSGRRPPSARRLLGPRIGPRPPRAADPLARRPRPGLLRRRADRRAPALRAGLRRPAGPVAVGRRHHRHPDRGRDRPCRSSPGARSATARAAGRDAPRHEPRAAGPARRAFAPSVVVLWVAALAAGAAGASIDVGIASVVSDNTPMSARAAAMAGWNAITGARGIVAAFLMSAAAPGRPGRRHDRAAAVRGSRPMPACCSTGGPAWTPVASAPADAAALRGRIRRPTAPRPRCRRP